ncbi:MAG: DUF488 family protein [Betaproteobacteria bacterium]|nr:MAG: DUF488 family protein [Betaproteobacteria bacterium]
MIRVVRLGTPRARAEGPRLGTVRRPPRGVRKQDYAKRDYYDLWLPLLSPSQKLVSAALSQPWTDARWRKFAAAYRREMKAPAAQQLLALLAQMSHHANFSVGCYCENEARCHRRVLKDLLREHGAKIGDG